MVHNMELNLSSLSREMHLLLSLLQLRNRENKEWEEVDVPPDLNWDHFLELSRHHRVFPEIYVILKRQKSAPPFVVQSLQKDYKKNILRMLGLSSEMEYICRTFAEHDIRVLLLKGPVLAVDLYGDVSLRTSGDLDILVPLQDLNRADQYLHELGYIKDDYIDTSLNDWKWRYHHVNYVHPSKHSKIEVHWRLHPGPAKEPGFEQLWERRKQSAISESPIYQLGDEDLFLFLVAHGARHGWSRLRWLTDLDRLCSKKSLEWNLLIKRSNQQWMSHVVGQALLLSIGMLQTPRMDPMLPFLRIKRSKTLANETMFYLSRMINLHTPPLPDDIAVYHQRHLFALMDVKQKCLFILSTLLPCSSDVKLLPLPKSLHFLYIPLRPVLWAWRRTRKMTSSVGGSP